MGMFVLIGIGFLIGMKCVLLTQFMILALFAIFMGFILGKDYGDLGLALAVWVLLLFAFGLVIGDGLYYYKWYNGTATIGDFFGWFFKP